MGILSHLPSLLNFGGPRNSTVFFCVYCAPMVLAQTFRKKIFCFNFFMHYFYLFLETKAMVVFQSIILHINIVIAF